MVFPPVTSERVGKMSSMDNRPAVTSLQKSGQGQFRYIRRRGGGHGKTTVEKSIGTRVGERDE